MSDQTNIHEDISYLRNLAESGRNGPVLGGVFLVAAGLVFGLASVISWAVREGLLPIKGWVELYLWLGASAVFAVFWVAAFLRLVRHKQAAATATNSAFGTIWGACGIGVMVVFATTLIIADRLHAPIVLNGYLPVIFSFYGSAWFASAALARRRWMFVAAAGSFAFSFLVALLAENHMQGLAMGMGLILLLSLPGLKLMSDTRR